MRVNSKHQCIGNEEFNGVTAAPSDEQSPLSQAHL